ncbi:hypothetical protein J6590_067154 [Homalodisca vitripennis]|nr:hypothetical protein J6590_067154 [Homalodisca vitripennis]
MAARLTTLSLRSFKTYRISIAQRLVACALADKAQNGDGKEVERMTVTSSLLVTPVSF